MDVVVGKEAEASRIRRSFENTRMYFEASEKIDNFFEVKADADKLTEQQRRQFLPLWYDRLVRAAFRLVPELSSVFSLAYNATNPCQQDKVVADFCAESRKIAGRINGAPSMMDARFKDTSEFARHVLEGYTIHAVDAKTMSHGLLLPVFESLLVDTSYSDEAFAHFVAKPLLKWHLSQKNGNDLAFVSPSPQDTLFLERALVQRPCAFVSQDLASDPLALKLCAPKGHPVESLCSPACIIA